MKTFYFLSCLLTYMGICILSPVQAQQSSYGVRAGVSVANWRGDAVQSLGKLVDVTNGMAGTNARTGIYVGGYMHVPVTAQISIEPGIYYSQKGYTISGDFSVKSLDFLGAGARAQVQSDYIDVPVLVKASLAPGLQVFAGPQISYLAHSDLHVDASVLGISVFKRDIDITDNFRKWDIAMTGGIAYQFASGLNIQAGYEHGLSRVDAGSRFRSFNQAVKLGIGFTF